MAVKIRLARTGAKKAPYYRVVVADSRAGRDGRFIEILGRYNPRTTPSTVELDVEKAQAWIAKGAQMTETVEKLLAIAMGTKEAPSVEAKPSKKVTAKAAAEEKAAADAKAKAATEAAAAKAAAAEAKDAAPVAEAPPEDAVEEADAEVAAEEAPAADAIEEADADAAAEEAPAAEAETSETE